MLSVLSASIWFHVNKSVILCCQMLTAYLDLSLNKCYIIALNTSVVMPPRNFHEFVANTEVNKEKL